MTSEGVTVYVKIDLADERYCDGCACHVLFMTRSGSSCPVFRCEIASIPGDKEGTVHYPRPHECVKASMSIGDDVRVALYARTEDRAEAQPCM